MHKRLVPPAALLLLAVTVGGCYLPARFDSEIELTRRGFYNIQFTGYVAETSLYQKLHAGEMSRAEENERVDLIKRDIKRDKVYAPLPEGVEPLVDRPQRTVNPVKEVSYFQKGHFKVVFEDSGDLIGEGKATFLRRNEDMISLTYDKRGELMYDGTGRVTYTGVGKVRSETVRDMVTLMVKSVSPENIERMVGIGLWSEGELRLKTEATVIDHNATQTRKGLGGTLLVWKIEGPDDLAFGRSPRAILSLR